jgi:hypothetical protein
MNLLPILMVGPQSYAARVLRDQWQNQKIVGNNQARGRGFV